MKRQQYLMDFSLGLINRTGAYIICRDILREMPEYFPEVRYWRLIRREPPAGLFRRIAGRLMLHELSLLKDRSLLMWPDGRRVPNRRRLILDPLYVLRSRLDPDDIVQCHDIGPVSHPELFGGRSLYEEAYEKIRRIGPGMVFVSDASQRAFRDRYGDGFRFMQTVAQYVRPGVLTGSTEPVPGVKPPFLLTVGALETRKNHLRVLEAYAQSGLHGRGVSYVFCGSRHLGADAILERAARTPGAKALGYVTEPQLRWLYENGCGFVLPSLLEGFGLPPIEAAQRGLVPVVSAGGAQEEAIGGAGVLVDPTSVDSIMQGMLRVVDMAQPEREELLRRAAHRGRVLSYARFIAGWHKVLRRNDAFEGTDGWAASDPEEHIGMVEPAA
ncbi:glycosyltransferase [Plastoroseomonas hellenica]|uniref:glycosyltransferase n=1 Tax=Plastoroseomonas hellenica TaxID=2687306 RepID=UPI001BA65D87|nr:glycosyltransferase [Plastoroseomonas hellenica]MBR0644498.1 glycosyltransferase family 4 protein [Plastoroseomonas hellenica]